MATRRRQEETIITEETVVETKNGSTVTTTKRTSTSHIPSSRPSSTVIQERTITSNESSSKRPVTMYSTTDFNRRPISMNLTDFDSKDGSSKPRAARPLSGNFSEKFSKFENKAEEPPKPKSSRPLSRPFSRLFGSRDKLAEPKPQSQRTTRPLSTNFSAAAVKPKTVGASASGGSSKPAQRPYSMIDTKQAQKQPPLQSNRTTKQPSKTQSALPSKPSFLRSPFKKGDPQSVSPSGSGKAPRAPQEKPPKPSLDDFKREILTAHNEYRNKHPGTPLLVWSDDLTKEAQQWVQRMADDDRMQHAPAPKRPGQGENLAGAWGEPMTGRKATDQWYDEIKNYNFSDPKQSKSPHGHFTQVVWKGSTQMGAAMATSGTGWNFIVARYRPAGNMRGAEKMNVLPLK